MTRTVVALLARDLTVLRRQPLEFLGRTVMQPLLLVFVLGYVSPKLVSGPMAAAQATRVATTMVAGMLAMVTLFQGIYAVTVPLIREFGYTREIEDRVLSPVPVRLVALAKVITGSVQGLFSAALVFPIAMFVPAATPVLHVHWVLLVTLAPLAALTCSSLGLVLGTVFDAGRSAGMFGMLMTPLLYIGCTLYPWSALSAVRWVQVLSLANPVTYVSEGFRASITTQGHLSLLVIYPVLVASAALLLWLGTYAFHRRVVS